MTQITIHEGVESISKESILALYNSVGWSTYTKDPDELMKAITNSTYVATCHIEDKLVGLARCVSDDSSICYLQDILIDPDFQRRGIGRQLLERCNERFKHVRTHVILTDDEERQAQFYESMGYKNTRSLKRTLLNCFVKMTNMKLE
ncbi:MAG: GNAT family N-acetyltransferase [candidate division Zixibacteria bacterium]|nr:GNAT family N-acetyltransferase [candidate division Zixibacteria bacterium]